MLLGCLAARGGVVYQKLTYDTNSITAWGPLDFNGDGTNDISFDAASTICIVEWPAGFCDLSLFLNGPSSTQVLVGDPWVLPLGPGGVVSANPSAGSWVSASPTPPARFGPTIWYSPTSNAPFYGVGGSGSGDYMGVRFLLGSEWHYGWIRLGPIPDSGSPSLSTSQPGVLAFAYETAPETPVVIEPEPAVLFPDNCRPVSFRIKALTQDLAYAVVSQTNQVTLSQSSTTNRWLHSSSILSLLENSFNTHFPPGAKLLLSSAGGLSFLVADHDKASLLLDVGSVLSLTAIASVHSGLQTSIQKDQGANSSIRGKDIEMVTEYATLTYDDTALSTRDGTATRFQVGGLLVQRRSTDLATGKLLDFISLRGVGTGTIRGQGNVILRGNLTGSIAGLP